MNSINCKSRTFEREHPLLLVMSLITGVSFFLISDMDIQRSRLILVRSANLGALAASLQTLP